MANEQFPVEEKKKGRPSKKESVLANSFQLLKEELVKETPPPPPLPPILSQTQMKTLALPKKPLSEAQKANFQRMLEANKKRREAQGKEPIESPPIPDEVPDGYKVVYVPPKHSVPPKEKKEKEVKVVERVVERAPQDLYEMIKQMNDRMNSFQMPAPIVVPVAPVPREKAPKATKKKVRKEETTEQESESDSGFDTSDTEYVKKYQKKAAKRMDAIQQIESKLKQQAPPRNKYDAMGSFF